MNINVEEDDEVYEMTWKEVILKFDLSREEESVLKHWGRVTLKDKSGREITLRRRLGS